MLPWPVVYEGAMSLVGALSRMVGGVWTPCDGCDGPGNSSGERNDAVRGIDALKCYAAGVETLIGGASPTQLRLSE